MLQLKVGSKYADFPVFQVGSARLITDIGVEVLRMWLVSYWLASAVLLFGIRLVVSTFLVVASVYFWT